MYSYIASEAPTIAFVFFIFRESRRQNDDLKGDGIGQLAGRRVPRLKGVVKAGQHMQKQMHLNEQFSTRRIVAH